MPLAGAVVLALAAAQSAPVEDVGLPQTAVRFAVRSEAGTLLGVGLRIKKVAFIKVKVYAVGLYVSDAALAGPLAAHRGKPAGPALFGDLVWGDFDKRLVLRFVRSLGAEQIRQAMREALADRTDSKLLDQFVGYFPRLEEGQECVLRWAPGGSLEVTMAGQPRPPLASKDFAAALFGLYLGDKPLQEDIKQGLVSRAAEVLGRS